MQNMSFGIQLTVDGAETAEGRNEAGPGGTEGYMTASVSIPLHLTTGQRVAVEPWELDVLYGSSNSGMFIYSWFSGYLLHAD